MTLQPLPIDPHVETIVRTLRERGSCVVVAPPGAGKTTRVPPALIDDGPVILLQPRRIAARSLARRIAFEQGWTEGGEVGWQVRFERRFGRNTRLLVATEGILTARLQSDPLLSGFRTVILDEFHERSIHADLALALARQARDARGDLRILVMSATLDAAPVSAYLGGCPIVTIEARPHPVEVVHRAGRSMAQAIREVLDGGTTRADGSDAAFTAGHILCFLPGVAEIRRVERELARATASGGSTGALVLPLHGTLPADQQDAALAPSSRRKVILATNLAETSLTVDGVTVVIDSGVAKVLRLDRRLAIDRLETERISRDSADQRAGRAGRTAPGRAIRLWDPRDLLRDHREPEIERVDLAGPFLDVLAWGGDPRSFPWFEEPAAGRTEAAMELLAALGAVEPGTSRITQLGRQIAAVPLPPRLARVFLAAGGTFEAAAACALLSEGRGGGRAVTSRSTREGAAGTGRDEARDTTDSDMLSRVDRIAEAPPALRQAAREIFERARSLAWKETPLEPHRGTNLLHALFLGFPDRVARRRAPGSLRFVLASGHGATLARESGVREAEFIVAIDVVAGAPARAGAAGVARQAGGQAAATEAMIRVASRIEPEWIRPVSRETTHRFDAESASVRAVERTLYRQLVLSERAVAVEVAAAAPILARELARSFDPDRSGGAGLDAATARTLRRIAFAGLAIDAVSLIERAIHGRTSLAGFEPAAALISQMPAATRRDLERDAPETLPLPSGRTARLEYRDDGSVIASVKLQELFGLGETPRIGPRREPVVFALCAPNGRPVQTTRDLSSFWKTVYPEVRRELRGRYPKHPWPEDPWTATPTHRAVRRQGPPRGSAR